MATSSVLHPAVARLYDLSAQIATLQAAYSAASQELLSLGDGSYCDSEGRRAVAIIPSKFSVSYNLYAAAALKAFLSAREAKKATAELLAEFRAFREERARQLAGDHFKTLFDRRVTFDATPGFDKLVPKLLTPAKGRETLLLCQVVKEPGKAHVKLSDKPKSPADPGEDEEPE